MRRIPGAEVSVLFLASLHLIFCRSYRRPGPAILLLLLLHMSPLLARPAPDRPAPVAKPLTVREAQALAQLIASKHAFVEYCASSATSVYVEVQQIAIRQLPGSVQISVNGQVRSADCMYIEKEGRYVHILERLHKRPGSQPALLPEEAIPADARIPDGEEVAREVFEETNRVRAMPAEYARYLEERLARFDGKVLRLPGRTPLATVEGRAAVEEAIGFLRAAKPLPALEYSKELSLVALDHVKDQGPRGALGHGGSNGSNPASRVRRRGINFSVLAENIAYGQRIPREILLALIVDDGVSDRGHRSNIFLGSVDRVGVACGPHKSYGWMCVQDFIAGPR